VRWVELGAILRAAPLATAEGEGGAEEASSAPPSQGAPSPVALGRRQPSASVGATTRDEVEVKETDPGCGTTMVAPDVLGGEEVCDESPASLLVSVDSASRHSGIWREVAEG